MQLEESWIIFRKLVSEYPLLDVDAVNKDQKSALDYAIEKGHLDVAFYLIQVSSDICPKKLELIKSRFPKLYERLLNFIPSVNHPISITYLCRDLQYLNYLAKDNFTPDRVLTIGPSQLMDLFSPQAVELMSLFPTAHHCFLDSDPTVINVLSKQSVEPFVAWRHLFNSNLKTSPMFNKENPYRQLISSLTSGLHQLLNNRPSIDVISSDMRLL